MVAGTVLCNNILMRAFDEGISVNPRKLQKLLYFIALDYLHNNNCMLFSENFSVWEHGPVLQTVYEEFKGYDNKSIITFSRDSMGNVLIVDEDEEKEIAQSISNVWKELKQMSGEELTQRSHEVGSGWAVAKEESSQLVSEKYMRKEIDLRYGNTNAT